MLMNQIDCWEVPEIRVVFCARANLNQWKFSNARDAFWRLYWHPGGGVEVEFADEIHQTTAKELLIISPETPFIPHLKTPGAVQFYVHFYVNQLSVRLTRKIYRIPCPHPYQGRLQSLVDSSPFPASGFWVTQMVSQVLGLIPAEDWQTTPCHPGVQRALDMIHQFPGDPLENATLAATAHLSVSSFHRHFREAKGDSPQQYVTRVRIERACSLLIHTQMTLEEICSRCGFTERAYFSRVFSRVTGESPAAYRKQHLRKET